MILALRACRANVQTNRSVTYRHVPELRESMSIFAHIAIAVFVSLTGFAAALTPATAQTSIRVVVNGDIITSYDIDQRARLLPLFGVEGGKTAATDQLIGDALKFQEAKKHGFRLSDTRVDTAFANMASERKMSAKQLASELGRMGIAADTMKQWIKGQMTWQQLVRARLRRDGKVKTSDVMAAMLEQGSPDDITLTEYRLQQIIFVAPSGSSTKFLAQRRREAERFRVNFPGCDGSLAQAKTLKGVVVRDLGRRDSSQLRGGSGDEIKNTAPGETTRPFKSSSGIELLAVCSSREFQSNAAAVVQAETKLKFEKAEKLGASYLKELHDVATIQHR